MEGLQAVAKLKLLQQSYNNIRTKKDKYKKLMKYKEETKKKNSHNEKYKGNTK